jgi:hypothetical protein
MSEHNLRNASLWSIFKLSCVVTWGACNPAHFQNLTLVASALSLIIAPLKHSQCLPHDQSCRCLPMGSVLGKLLLTLFFF